MARASGPRSGSTASANATSRRPNSNVDGKGAVATARRRRRSGESTSDDHEEGEPFEEEPAEALEEADDGSEEVQDCEDEKEATELRLANALADFLRERHHPRGLAAGALAGSEVRQALRDPMRAAGVRSFKAKFLSRFPAELLFDGKSVKAAPIRSSLVGTPSDRGHNAIPSAEQRRNSEACSTATRPSSAPTRSCLRRASEPSSNPMQRVSKQAPIRRPSFASIIDVLMFKLGHEPGAVSVRGQHVKRPMSQRESDSEEEEEDEEDEDSEPESPTSPNAEAPEVGSRNGDHRAGSHRKTRQASKYHKDAWLDPSMLPPIVDPVEEEEEDEELDTSSPDKVVEVEEECNNDHNEAYVLAPPALVQDCDPEDEEWTKV